MEQIGNLVVQFFGAVILPILLPIFLLSILIGMRKPEALMSEVFAVLEAILGMFVKILFGLIKSLARLIGTAITPKSTASKNKYPKKYSYEQGDQDE